MEPEGEMTLELFSHWDIKALQSYLGKRDLKKTRSKATLVARCFTAWELGVPVKISAEEERAKLTSEYNCLLIFKGSQLPDPSNLSIDQWTGERNGKEEWPQLKFENISNHLMSEHPGKDTNLADRLLNDYKEGKAYSYFRSGWLQEVYVYNFIWNEENLCFLKAACTPSFRVDDTPHHAWVCMYRTGEIITAYCTCTAG